MDVTTILAAGVASGTILLFAAIGEIFAERSGQDEHHDDRPIDPHPGVSGGPLAVTGDADLEAQTAALEQQPHEAGGDDREQGSERDRRDDDP